MPALSTLERSSVVQQAVIVSPSFPHSCWGFCQTLATHLMIFLFIFFSEHPLFQFNSVHLSIANFQQIFSQGTFWREKNPKWSSQSVLLQHTWTFHFFVFSLCASATRFKWVWQSMLIKQQQWPLRQLKDLKKGINGKTQNSFVIHLYQLTVCDVVRANEQRNPLFISSSFSGQ